MFLILLMILNSLWNAPQLPRTAVGLDLVDLGDEGGDGRWTEEGEEGEEGHVKMFFLPD